MANKRINLTRAMRPGASRDTHNVAKATRKLGSYKALILNGMLHGKLSHLRPIEIKADTFINTQAEIFFTDFSS